MTSCRACGGETDSILRLQEVLTMHVRGTSEQRVQALGEDVELALCSTCLDAYVQAAAQPPSLKRLAPRYALMGALGLMLFLLLPGTTGPTFKLFGAALFLLAVLGFFQARQKGLARANAARKALQEGQSLHLAGEYAAALLPKKSGENDLTYILLEPRLLLMPAGDMMLRYGLLPDIALQLRAKISASQAGEGADASL